MHDIAALIRHFGLAVVFVSVLLESLGLPLPSFAIVLIAAGASFDERHTLPWDVMGAAFGAGICCDLFWYWAGRRYGYRLLHTLCRISLSPDSCVKRTESVFARWGSATLLVSRFVPGLSVVAQPLAGVVRRPGASFLLYDGLGLLLWAGVAVGLGVTFSTAIDDVLDVLSRFGMLGAVIVLGLFALWLGRKLAQRHVLLRRLRMDRITVDELKALIESGEAPLIFDVRASEEQQQHGVIPGAIATSENLLPSLALPADSRREIVVYCACPDEASAVSIAHALMKRGYERVRPLRGGADAWRAAGFTLTVLAVDAPAVQPT
jgi:membrane protein DedA with SNARE-associated domain/rhodanese-related sulfurtransferase